MMAVLALFLLQNFYFAFFELRWQGWTPGKRLIGIQRAHARTVAAALDYLERRQNVNIVLVGAADVIAAELKTYAEQVRIAVPPSATN